MNRLLSLLALSLLCVFTACEDDNGSPSGGGGGEAPVGKTFTAVLNNQAYVAAEESDIAGGHDSQNGIHSWVVVGLRSNSSTSESISLTITATDSSDFHVGSTFNSGNVGFDRYCAGTYRLLDDTGQLAAYSEALVDNAAHLTITAIDVEAGTWSASFYFTAEDDAGMVYDVTNGIFTEVLID